MLSVEAESGRCRRTLHKWSIALLAKEMAEHIAAGSVTRSRALSFVKELAALHAESVSLELSTTTVDKKLVPMPGSVDDANAFLLLPVTGSAAPPAQDGPTLALTLENFLHGAVQEAREVHESGAAPEEVGVLRFPIETRVMARCPNRGCSLYHPGVVVALYPFPSIPYRVMLDKEILRMRRWTATSASTVSGWRCRLPRRPELPLKTWRAFSGRRAGESSAPRRSDYTTLSETQVGSGGARRRPLQRRRRVSASARRRHADATKSACSSRSPQRC